MNSEKHTKIKAITIYVIVAAAAAIFFVYFYGARNNIRESREAIYKEKVSLNIIGNLIKSIEEVQNSAYDLFSSGNIGRAAAIKGKIEVVNTLSDSLLRIYPQERAKLTELSLLLSEQFNNIRSLSSALQRKNPVNSINEKLSSADIIYTDSILVTNVVQDTVVISSPKKKRFFKRFAELFKPSSDTALVALAIKTDTIRLGVRDTLPIIMEVDTLAQSAHKLYEENIKDIESRINRLLTANSYITSKISALLMELHTRSIDYTIKAIEKSKNQIQHNYILAIICAAVSLSLILLFIIMIIADVNKSYRTRKELEIAGRELKEVMESRHQLMLGVSHDIKSPLSSIIGYLRLSEQETPQTRSMLNSSRYILSLVENMLAFFNLKEGEKLHITESRVNLNEICSRCGEMFEPIAASKGLKFRYHSSETTVISDQMKLCMIINNIVSNAIKYTVNGEVSLTISFADSFITIKVEDTGAGIPEEKLQELYKPFTRVEKNNKLDHGSGLGMYVVKGLCDLLGGKLDIKSEVGKGTSVGILIPAEPCNNIPYSCEQMRIAVFDDDPAVAEVARQMLLKLGHKIVEEDYNIILTDMEMGSLSGMDVLASAGNIPVVLMSGHADFSRAKAVALGFADYLPKPFTLSDMQAVFGTQQATRKRSGLCADNSLKEMLGEDYEQIMALFESSTRENIAHLGKALEENDFAKAQAVCHKMHPMFAQLGYKTDELKKMDASRGNEYQGWQTDIQEILKEANKIIG